ncbi:MAG: EamA family transporter [Scytolyngbya sp. HA4215-MV1]|nr:EamA family transporter [Scytolyngbya sp. HA4215-MV1]
MSHFYIFLTIFLTVYGQIVIKWQASAAGELPTDSLEKVWFLLHLLLNPWILSGLIGAFLASISWMAAMTKFQLSYAYPFTGLSFVLVLLAGALIFHETLTLPRLIGTGLVIAGIIIGSQA